ncbi:3-hydroxyacyl-CoA dehydrogenase family protein [Limosilactobacillus sp.]|jgi:3-hydroxybutyryl-CoA dehydrogenase|uniref:3-hydroxyacyl-CoA dehydrogenase family protein n=1 Tax=Limosilactobacillus sp. TaxID=2773925 RepID=UPI0025C2CB7F|nr:3-hydroxyacyl-CoA dehydrogenase family protein [Limosilactobacillus sp.]MCH3922838.1 3-hydroxyacyl-CoA dehydrogenase family protein [Limosilactobacillus sp.]MCH3927521.1 3-hydroxyacyl-CoA dehydrogenase family protein [Limosilactobacillus sp.]
MKVTDIKRIANIGAGTMGHATALQFAMHGYPVNLYDRDEDGLARGKKLIEHDLATFQQAGMLDEDPATVLQRINYTTDLADAVSATDFVIESIVENQQIKQTVWQEIEQSVRPTTVLATNTSGLSPTALQSVLKHPERFVVAHFWNPAQLMPLVEVVPGQNTDSATVQLTVELMNKIGKHAVPLKKEALGFVGNRIQLAVLREAFHIVDEGIASPEAVDDIVKYSLGRRWNLVGPIASADLGGLDVFKNISSYLYADLANETGTDPTLAKKVEASELGLKTGHGFFDWQGDAGQQMVANRDQKLLKQLKDDQQK